jgi:DNA-directed RNA polymerase specialized sigma24 family protein
VSEEPEDFVEFVEARERALQRTAWLLTGDRGLAEDLVQTALARTWPRMKSGNEMKRTRTRSPANTPQPRPWTRTSMARSLAPAVRILASLRAEDHRP